MFQSASFVFINTKSCSKIWLCLRNQKARTEFSNGNFDAAVEYLQQIDMTSSCAAEAKQLCMQIKQTKDAEARRAVELIERQSQRETDLEKTRIKAARDVAVAYCKRRRDVYFIW